jgi:hypothetical protein
MRADPARHRRWGVAGADVRMSNESDLATIERELDWLHTMIAAMENGMVVTHDGVDVTAQQLAHLKQMTAYLDAILLRFNHPIN